MTTADVSASPVATTRADHLVRLRRLCDSDLEHAFLDLLEGGGYRLPSDAQTLIESARTKPDFVYWDECVAVYIDGPHHRYAHRAKRDRTQQSALEDLGWTVLRFAATDDWDAVIDANPGTFGRSQ